MKIKSFGIVTPTYNQAKFIRDTIESVIFQKGDFQINYTIIDGGSSDGTVQILQEYQDKINSKQLPLGNNGVNFKFISEPDEGMYDAISKGFKNVEGEIQAWINSDDIYNLGIFQKIKTAFEIGDEILWVKGITDYINETGDDTHEGTMNLYDQVLIQNGFYGCFGTFIQQDSLFWRGDLYDKVGGIDKNFKLAGDYDLWIRFAKFSPLVSLNLKVSRFRKWGEQKSANIAKYYKEATKAEFKNTILAKFTKKALEFKSLNSKLGMLAYFYLKNLAIVLSLKRKYKVIENGKLKELSRIL